ncbi:hypothetical protein BW737_007990 [Actinomyces ruminis]|uniref:Uncharacterized protein n=1 Tax=Actinomyces ruminis TaxID=1937003 RepID=A0ABX4MBD4_9ACTO|nr:hypothetical protein BW737_007990 [Actinomyces ruminis]
MDASPVDDDASPTPASVAPAPRRGTATLHGLRFGALVIGYGYYPLETVLLTTRSSADDVIRRQEPDSDLSAVTTVRGIVPSSERGWDADPVVADGWTVRYADPDATYEELNRSDQAANPSSLSFPLEAVSLDALAGADDTEPVALGDLNRPERNESARTLTVLGTTEPKTLTPRTHFDPTTKQVYTDTDTPSAGPGNRVQHEQFTTGGCYRDLQAVIPTPMGRPPPGGKHTNLPRSCHEHPRQRARSVRTQHPDSATVSEPDPKPNPANRYPARTTRRRPHHRRRVRRMRHLGAPGSRDRYRFTQ